MRLILHVGMHKTGTSALQAKLRSNAHALLQQRILYPAHGRYHDGSHHGLWPALASAGSTSDFLRALSAECEAQSSPVDTVLISSELLEKVGMNAKRSENIHTFLDSFDDVHVLYFLRNQGEVIQSIFKQWVKDDTLRIGMGPSEFLRTQGAHLFYSRYCDWWSSLDRHVRLSVSLYDGKWESLWTRFQDMSGFQIADGEPSRIYNASMDGRQLKLKHWLNRHVPREQIDFDLNSWLTKNFPSTPRTSLFKSEEDFRDFQSAYDEDNARLAKEWGVSGLDSGRVSGAYFQTASPELVEVFFAKLRQDAATRDSALCDFVQ